MLSPIFCPSFCNSVMVFKFSIGNIMHWNTQVIYSCVHITPQIQCHCSTNSTESLLFPSKHYVRQQLQFYFTSMTYLLGEVAALSTYCSMLSSHMNEKPCHFNETISSCNCKRCNILGHKLYQLLCCK